MIVFQNELSLVIGGAAGRGIQTVEALLLVALKGEGYSVFASKEYMSRIRGGSNSTEIRVTSQARRAFVRTLDVLVLLDEAALAHASERLSSETVIVGDASAFREQHSRRVIDAPLAKMALECGDRLLVNTVAAGILLGVCAMSEARLEASVWRVFGRKGEEVVTRNLKAIALGYAWGKEMATAEGIEVRIARSERNDAKKLLSGADTLGMGVVAAGCDFISSYPMSPGTSLLTFLAQVGQRFGIAVEQVEDEIAAINMALGASFTGARAIVTTSGGGFALMEEGVSLAGMIETPIVIHIAQRPGPATGLPTRTEQGDLNLALYSGHGEFPRAIFAPGDQEEMFALPQQAFLIADAYQSPVFLLTDQFLLDAIAPVDETDLKRLPIEKHVVRTDAEYVRYAVTESGVSPRGIPGLGEGLVVVDSDEHTEDGHITEDFDVRRAMMDKRMRKLDGMRQEALPPVVTGELEQATIVVVGWGSTKSVIAEALEKSGRTDMVALHFGQVYPLPLDLDRYFAHATKVVVVEHNFTGQFADLLKLHGVAVHERILKYTGEPFSVEELVEKFQAL